MPTALLLAAWTINKRTQNASLSTSLALSASSNHLLYADDLTLMANDPDAMLTMLNCLHWYYAQRKHLIINTAKSEVVHFNSSGSNAPAFNVGRVSLTHKDSYRLSPHGGSSVMLR